MLENEMIVVENVDGVGKTTFDLNMNQLVIC
jgi:hypothetical protein